MRKQKATSNNIGIAGEFYIAHILAKNNFKVNVSLGRTEGFDLFVQNPFGTNMVVSVKTTYSSKSKEIIMDKKAETLTDESLFYAFVRLNMPEGEPEYWIVPSFTVAKAMVDSDKVWMDKPKRDGSKHKETKMRLFGLGTHSLYPDDWQEQLDFFKSNIRLLEEDKKNEN